MHVECPTDLLDPLARRRLQSAFPRALQVSAATGEGLDALKERIGELFSDRFEDVRLLPSSCSTRTILCPYLYARS